MTRAIGIDLGTTYSVAATLEKGRPTILPNAEGAHLTPSVVGFTLDGNIIVGQAAKSCAASNPEGTIFSIKRHMGSAYRIVHHDREFRPEEISSLILRKVKEDIETVLGEKVKQAVITVPAYFNDRQRQATREAGIMAGLEVLRIINEPTAAALAYGLEREDAHTILVWDLGGGTFDVSILDLGDQIFEVRAVSGDAWLGGDDFDSRIADYIIEEFQRISGLVFPPDPVSRQILREEAEAAKIRLSSAQSTAVRLPPGFNGDHAPEIGLTRIKLEELTADLLRRMEACTQQAMTDAGLRPSQIDRVILVGGGSRMPAVRRLIKTMMGREPYRYVDPDEVVAAGAAIEAGMILGLIDKAVLLDVLPLTLGVETQGGLTAGIISRNTPLPASGHRVFATAADYQTSFDIHVVQGERQLASDNISLGQFEFKDIPSAPRGVSRIEVAFEADVDGIVHVSAEEFRTGQEINVKISCSKLLDSQEISNLAEEAQRNLQDDNEKAERIRAGIEAGNLVDAAETMLQRPPVGTAGLTDSLVEQAIFDLKKSLEDGPSARVKQSIAALRKVLESRATGSLPPTVATPARFELGTGKARPTT